MPFTIYLIIIILTGILFLLNNLKSTYKVIYATLVAFILVVYWSRNFPLKDSRNEQQLMLSILRESHDDSVVCLPYSSNFFSWDKIDNPGKSYYVSQLLHDWGITERKVVFYQK